MGRASDSPQAPSPEGLGASSGSPGFKILREDEGAPRNLLQPGLRERAKVLVNNSKSTLKSPPWANKGKRKEKEGRVGRKNGERGQTGGSLHRLYSQVTPGGK